MVALESEELKNIVANFTSVFKQAPKFPNVRDVRITFDGYWEDSYDADQCREISIAVCVHILIATSISLRQMNRLRSLDIDIWPVAANNKVLLSSPDLTAVLSTISVLEILIIPSRMHPNSSVDISYSWLKSASHNLTTLTIYGETYEDFQSRPVYDFRGVHFPNPRHLNLVNPVSLHDWQLNWILAHGNTLEKLVLYSTAIVSYVSVDDRFGDFSEIPISADQVEKARSDPSHLCRYTSRWSSFFNQLEAQLPKLKTFVFTADHTWNTTPDPDLTPWGALMDRSSRYIGWAPSGDPEGSCWDDLGTFLEIFKIHLPRSRISRNPPIDWNEVAYDEDRATYNKVRSTRQSSCG